MLSQLRVNSYSESTEYRDGLSQSHWLSSSMPIYSNSPAEFKFIFKKIREFWSHDLLDMGVCNSESLTERGRIG